MKRAISTLLLAITFPASALACSPVAGYRVPTNVELLERADLVVLASVIEGPDNCKDFGKKHFCFPSVILEPLKVLKGQPPQGVLTATGSVRDGRDEPYSPLPTKLDEANPSTFWGACSRRAYSQKSLVIAMYSESDGEFRQYTPPFSRGIEDVEGPGGLWVRAAELYLGLLSENASHDRRRAFMNERDRLITLTGDTDAQAIAADIEAYLEATAEE